VDILNFAVAATASPLQDGMGDARASRQIRMFE
jgi:hypothetical protein